FIAQIGYENPRIAVTSSDLFEEYQLQRILVMPQGQGTPFETTVGKNEFFYIQDTSHSSTAWNIGSLGSSEIRSYAGQPVNWPDGEIFGAICLINTESLPPIASPLYDVLQDYGRLIERDLEVLLHDSNLENVEDVYAQRMKEVSHRAKNHFSIMSNLIQISAAKPQDSYKQVLLDMDAKIRSMARLHEILYTSNSLNLPVAQFLEDVVSITTQLSPHSVQHTIDLEDLPVLDGRYVFDLGLLISELTTNAIKYFDPSVGSGLRLVLSAKKLNDISTLITFRDNGPGISQEILDDPTKRSGIGFTMLRNLVRLMNGRVSRTFNEEDSAVRIYNDDGAVIELTLQI
ncbi:MAG: sensor histidine kinase, partial [Actinobacteria bacterium]|nr:sensor histidine kinase [Actinomycetota bacterium]